MKKTALCISFIFILFSCNKNNKGISYWDNIYKKAVKEKTVIIYSISSRMTDAFKDFNNKFPGINVLIFDVTEQEIIEVIQKDRASGKTNIDVVTLSGEKIFNQDFQYYFENYIPPVLLDNVKTADVIDKHFIEPVLTQSIEADQILYNTEKYSKAPIDNLWDLTKKEWNSKIYLKNPLLEFSDTAFFYKLIKEDELMKEAYYREYKNEIVLKNDIKNAAYEWIYRFFNNDLHFTTSTGSAAKQVGAPNQTDPPLGFLLSSAKLRYNEDGYHLGIADNVYPVSGTTKKIIINISKNSKSPNASKLAVAWLMGYKNGDGGIKPFNMIGQWPARKDIKAESGVSLSEVLKKTWLVDSNTMKNNYDKEAEVFWKKYLK